jgi:hypothetical protein
LGAANKLVRRSTRTTDLAEAKLTAEELYEELRFAKPQFRHHRHFKLLFLLKPTIAMAAIRSILVCRACLPQP